MNEGVSRLETAKSFRLTEIARIRIELQNEVESRQKTCRRYKTANTTTHAVNVGMCVVGSVTSAGTVGTLATGVGVIVALPLGAIALATGVLGVIGSSVQKIILKKLLKHVNILTLAETKLSTINGLMSKALKDNHVTDEEFDTIQQEMNDYHAKKREIRTKTRDNTTADIEGLKKQLLEQGRQQGLTEAKNTMT